MVSYKPLWITLAEKGLKKKDLYDAASPATVARMARNEYVALEIIDKLCARLGCPISAVVEYVPGDSSGRDV